MDEREENLLVKAIDRAWHMVGWRYAVIMETEDGRWLERGARDQGEAFGIVARMNGTAGLRMSLVYDLDECLPVEVWYA